MIIHKRNRFIGYSTSIIVNDVLFRSDSDWNAGREGDASQRRNDDDGPSGMGVDGTIETNWHEVGSPQ